MKYQHIWTRLLTAAVAAASVFGCGAQAADEQTLAEESQGFGNVQQALGVCSALTIDLAPADTVEMGTTIDVTATADGCTKPRYRFDIRGKDESGNWSDWIFWMKGKGNTGGLIAFSPTTVQVRVKVKEKAADGWQVIEKRNLRWTDSACGSETFVCDGELPDCPSCDAGICLAVAEGGGLCASANTACGAACMTSDDCGPGNTCVMDTCCSESAGTCIPDECPAPATMSEIDGSEKTITSLGN